MMTAAPTVLLAEDDPNDVVFIQRAWQRAQLNQRLVVVGDGDTAVEYLAGQGLFADRVQYPFPVLLLLDLKLPRRSGFEVLAWLRQQPTLRRLPVVILTASRLPADVERAYDLHVNSYLAKPPAPAALQQLVETLHQYWLTVNESPP